jgi:hypothetical protein
LIDELKPESCALKPLLDETLLATKDGANNHLIATKVVIAEYEKIVANESFGVPGNTRQLRVFRRRVCRL